MVANKIITWVKQNKLIVAIILLALFLRLFRIASYMTFLGDEGRDALVWLRMVRNFKLTLIGPQTSIGNMYLGPLYYYLMLPFYLILGTTGPSIGTALFAGVTTYLLWLFGQKWFSSKVGLMASFFYAISPVAIVLSRSSWNPNVMPFFSLVIIWGVWQFWQNNKFYWLAIEGVLLSFAIQSHYLGILLAPVVGLFFVIKLIFLIKQKSKKTKSFLTQLVWCVLLFVLLTILPLVWFDLRHGFINYQSFYKFFSERQTTVNFKPYKAIPQIWPLWQNLVTRLLAGKNEALGFWLALGLGICFLLNTIRNLFFSSNKKNKAITLLILSWLGFGLIGMGLYKQHIYDHYFGFLFPLIFLLFALVIDKIWSFRNWTKPISLAVFVLAVVLAVSQSPLKYQPGFQMQRTKEVSDKIIVESKNQPFNLGLIAKQNYDAGYRYFLEKQNKKATEIDPQIADQTITDQLFVICEISECQPATHPQAEIANFGWSKIGQEWDFPWGTKLFKLVHY